jgi:hypothetical protein
MAFNPLTDALPEKPASDRLESTSALFNEVVGTCPKCKEPFGSGFVNNVAVYYCDKCRVSHPIPK